MTCSDGNAARAKHRARSYELVNMFT